MKVYCAMPMTGIPDSNRATAEAMRVYVAGCGDTPIIPHRIPPRPHEGPCPDSLYPGAASGSHSGLCHLRADLIVMLDCDRVLAAPGWQDSRGAVVEVRTALSVGIPIWEWSAEGCARPLPPARRQLHLGPRLGKGPAMFGAFDGFDGYLRDGGYIR